MSETAAPPARPSPRGGAPHRVAGCGQREGRDGPSRPHVCSSGPGPGLPVSAGSGYVRVPATGSRASAARPEPASPPDRGAVRNSFPGHQNRRPRSSASAGTMTVRRSLVVVLRDDEGHVGYGESPPFELPFYSEETVGSARLLLEQGVPVYGLFTPWAKQDPAGALQAWNEWGDPRSNASVDALREILAARTVKPENAAELEESFSQLEESFSQLDEASLTRLKTAWTEMEKKRPWAVRELRKKSPLLESWSSPATTVPDP